MVSSSECNAQSEPIIKGLDILKDEHLFSPSFSKYVH